MSETDDPLEGNPYDLDARELEPVGPSREEWETVYPRPERTEVELVGGPRDGERRALRDLDAPLILHEHPAAATGEPPRFVARPEGVEAFGSIRHVYRRRLVDDDQPEPMPIRFDYQPLTRA